LRPGVNRWPEVEAFSQAGRRGTEKLHTPTARPERKRSAQKAIGVRV